MTPFIELKIDSVRFPLIDLIHRNHLERSFKKEVVAALKELRRDKAPSLNGFMMACFQHVGRYGEDI